MIINIFIVIPVFNEEKNIKAVIEDIRNEIPDSNIVVVDDYSNNDTVRIAKNILTQNLFSTIIKA